MGIAFAHSFATPMKRVKNLMYRKRRFRRWRRAPAKSIDPALDGVTAIICAIGAGRGDPSNGPEFVDYGGCKKSCRGGR